jgi:hypothetical protein
VNTVPGAYPIVEHLNGVTLVWGPALPANFRLGSSRLAMDKHFRLLQSFVNYALKGFITVSPEGNSIKLFTSVIYKCS